jgi:hypothetical protein
MAAATDVRPFPPGPDLGHSDVWHDPVCASVGRDRRPFAPWLLGFAVAAFIAAGITVAFGAFLNKYAPVRGGSVIVLMECEK